MKNPSLRHALICGSILPLAAHAQPVLNDIGHLVIGMEMNYLSVQPQTMYISAAGQDVMWDLAAIGSSTDTIRQIILPPDSSPYSSLFPTASLIEMNSDSSQAFIQQGTSDRLVGYVTSEGLVMTYPDPYDFLSRPFTYHDSLADTSVRSYYFGENQISGFGSTLTHADAYGTLILPNGSYTDVLRVRFEQNYSDTDATTGMVTNANTISYSYFDQEHRGALLKVDSIFINSMFFDDTLTSVRYLIHETPLSIEEPISDAVNAYYNGMEIRLQEELSGGERIDMHIFDPAGKLMHATHLNVVAAGADHAIPLPASPTNAIRFVRIAIINNGTVRIRAIKIIN